MNRELNRKLDSIRNRLKDLGSVLVAFSGGVDSSLVLMLAVQALEQDALAVTARSVFNPPGEVGLAAETAQTLGARHRIIEIEPLEIEPVRNNRRDRCYHCKASLAEHLKAEARKVGIEHILEGSQADDEGTHRPGEKALREAGILSPLKDAGLTKADVRQALKEYGLPHWDQPAAGCLATRFPYDTPLDPDMLKQVFETERILADEGLKGFRARHHGDIVRLELTRSDLLHMHDDSLRLRPGP